MTRAQTFNKITSQGDAFWKSLDIWDQAQGLVQVNSQDRWLTGTGKLLGPEIYPDGIFLDEGNWIVQVSEYYQGSSGGIEIYSRLGEPFMVGDDIGVV